MSKLHEVLARLGEIKARAEAATDGPWYDDMSIAGDGSVVMSEATCFRVAHFPSTEYCVNHECDSEFVAHARTDVPDMAEALEEARELLGRALGLEALISHVHVEGYQCSTCATLIEIRRALGR